MAGLPVQGAPLPRPSPAEGWPLAAVPVRVAAKLARYRQVRAAGLTEAGRARRLLDLDHPTEMDRLERVLASFGVALVVTTRKPTGSAPGDLAERARRGNLA